MATRQDFRIDTELRFERDTPAVEAVLFVIEDEFGKACVRRWHDDDTGELRARIQCTPQPVDARRANWLHEQIAILAKYLVAAADVDCADATDGDRSYRLEPARPAAAEPPPDSPATEQEPLADETE